MRVPTVNKGLKSPPVIPAIDQRVAAIIDFLTCTFSAESVKALVPDSKPLCSGYDAQHEESQHEVARIVLAHLGLLDSVQLNGTRGGFRSFYDHHFKLYTPEGDVCGILAFGGERQRHTMMLQLTGGGCAHVQAWAKLRERLEDMRARITRVDVAHDDYEGRYTVADAVKWHKQGLFTTTGRPPALQVVGWDDGSGKSVYIGKNTGNQQLVVYEKGREQGFRDGETGVEWVRWEARFGAEYRDIPLSVLTDPVGYLIGHYPPLQYWIEARSSRMRTSKVRAEANLAHSIRWARRQYGSLIGLLAEHIPEPELFARFLDRHVVKKTPPPWLKTNPFGASVISAAIEGRMELSP